MEAKIPLKEGLEQSYKDFLKNIKVIFLILFSMIK